MKRAPILMVGLDGFELEVAQRLLAEGRLPALRRLQEAGATVLLDHGPAKQTGLAWEHVSSGRDPDTAERWAAVDFDPQTYRATQEPTRSTPFLDGMDVSAVVFDAPYFDLLKAGNASGMVNWGAHDPGIPQSSRPASLAREIIGRFGEYPATEWIYGFTWPSVPRTEAMAAALVDALNVRSAITQWLFGDRFPDWDLGVVVISEYHSAIEAMWHGVDPHHPLHSEPSAAAARRGVEGVYEAGDRMLGALMDRFPDARLVAFSMHGMGANDADVPSMLLLPELLYRHRFGKPLFAEPAWTVRSDGMRIMDPDAQWETVMSNGFPRHGRLRKTLERKFAAGVRRLSLRPKALPLSLDWMPAKQYERFWRHMPAFALPSFYDGRVRINLVGRESEGVVDPEAYDDMCDKVENLVRACTDPATGQPIATDFIRSDKDKFALSRSEADMIIRWDGAPLGLDHPGLGTIGPVPYRRTGGHTGKSGVAYFSDPAGLEATQSASSFDVVPTVIDMLGLEPVAELSGRSLT